MYNSKLRNLIMAAVLILASLPASAKPLSLVIGGKPIFLHTPPVADGGEVYVSLPALRAVGATAKEVGEVKNGERKLEIKPASGDRFTCSARVVDGVVMVPMRKIAGDLGAAVQWDPERSTMSIRAQLEKIEFDGSKLKVRTSYPVTCEIVESSWTRSAKKFVLDIPGLDIPRSAEEKIDNDTKIPIRLGMQDGETGRIVLDLPFAIKARKDSLARTSELSISISPSLKDAPAPRVTNPSEGVAMPRTQPPPEPVKLSGIEYRDRGSKRIDVTIAADAVSKYTTYMLRDPDRFVVEVRNAKIEGDAVSKDIKHSITTGMRMTQFNQDTVRAVIDLTRPVAFDVQQGKNGTITVSLEMPRNAGGSLAGKTVVIDPGHGGSENGAQANGCCEKVLNLAMALRVERLLKDAGAIVLLTRRSDVQVDLKERPLYAARHSADLFLSIHHNAMGSANKVSGTETFYHGNDSSGRALAHCIQSEVVAANKLPDRGVKSDFARYQTGFAVLRGATMPSALLEIAFLDHAGDAACAVDSAFQEKVATAIVRGLRTYVEGSPNTPVRRPIKMEEPPVEKPREEMTTSRKDTSPRVKEISGEESKSGNSLIPKGRVK